jgi:hypothetical protein
MEESLPDEVSSWKEAKSTCFAESNNNRAEEEK